MPFHTLSHKVRLAALASAAVLTGVGVAAIAVRKARRTVSEPVDQFPVGWLPEVVPYPGPDTRPDRIALGVYADGTQADVRLRYAPHMLVVGPTGSGKSVLQRSILFHCLTHVDHWNIVGIDLSKVELSWLKKYDNATVATTLDETVIALAGAYNDMTARYLQMEEAGVNHSSDLPDPPKATLVMIDEAGGLFTLEGIKSQAGIADDFLRSEAQRMVGDIARLGRAASIHLVVGTQRDTPDSVGDLRRQFDARIMAGRCDSNASHRLFGSDIAADLPKVRGRGVLGVHGNPEAFQSYYAAPDWYDNQPNSNAPIGAPPTTTGPPSNRGTYQAVGTATTGATTVTSTGAEARAFADARYETTARYWA